MSEDAIRWDEKYQNRKHPGHLNPDPLLVQYQELFKPRQRVVDLASGTGRHSVLLAQLGCFVMPFDCSQIALAQCCEHAKTKSVTIYPVVADLTDFRFPPQCVDAMICFNYLNRELSDNMIEALKPGGIVLMQTFNRNFLTVNPRFNLDYALKPGELEVMFKGLDFIHLDDDCRDSKTTVSSIVGMKR